MLHDDMQRALRELRQVTGALLVEVTHDPQRHNGLPAHTRPLGDDAYLRVELGERTPAGLDIAEALERSARHLRTIARLWETSPLPEMVIHRPTADGLHDTPAMTTKTAAAARLHTLLTALARQDRADNAVIVRRGEIVASAAPLSDSQALRVPLLTRQIQQHQLPGSSHGEHVAADAFGISFWYEAELIVFTGVDYGVDFLRHRCHKAAKELAPLLALLEPDPPAPAREQQRPE